MQKNSKNMTNNNKKKHLTSRMIIMIIALVIIFGGIFGFGVVRSIFMKKYFASFSPPPATISTAKARTIAWRPAINAVGSIVAINGAEIEPKVSGKVVKIGFESGQMVKAGDFIIQLDDDEEKADLENLTAQLKLAEITFRRQSILFKQQAVAAAGLDEARASLQQLRAQVAKAQELVVNKRITAPFAGRLGIRQVNLGQFLAAGTAIVSLQSMDPLYVNFSLPQQYLPDLYVGQDVQLQTDAFGAELFPGKINALNAEVNVNTRNILVQATIPNPKLKLYPGMFTNVNVLAKAPQQVIVVPQTSVTYNLYGNSVFVVKAESKDKEGKPILKAFAQYVTTGDNVGNEVIITKGLQAGDEVVTSGQLKLTDGAQVIINNSVDLKQNSTTEP